MDLLFLLLLLFSLLSLCLSVSACCYPSKRKPNSHLAFKSYPLLGIGPDFLRNRHRFFDWTSDILCWSPNNTTAYCRPGMHGILTANPLNVEHILRNNFDNYPKGPSHFHTLKDFLGRGIFNADGNIWKVQRKIASFEFNTKSLRSFAITNVKEEIQTRLVPLLRKTSELNQVVDMQDILERFAFDNICKLAFNVDPGCLGGDGTAGAEFMKAFDDASLLSVARFFDVHPLWWKTKKALNIGSERRLREAIRMVHDFSDNIIRSRMEEEGGKQSTEDLLSRFVADDLNSPEFLRDIVISFILAGRDTTSSTLAWFFWLLSSRPDIEHNILDELKSIRTRTRKEIGDAYSFEELREMHYLQAAISEALRLYPPVAMDTKVCLKDDVLPDGTSVRKGWVVTYHAYAMGRMECIWGKDCREFRPERWLENGSCRQESPFRFSAFHAGPRMCLGKDMAYIQMKSIAASVVERFHIDVVDGLKCPELLLSLTIRMKGGLPVRVKERCFHN
ncbi:PREDICTED: cytochrome P450 94B3-like [Nelumbo nucifera]|uniref:Cytochrome P450 94B3-like n=2 Tax=Nelumbo nucifera TaxID=4432 RepID=A0A1U7Z293_NELNU|nr:PREDICTED: cytochrome P450 94B3-like [Nelumbo nucifera]DAD42960.1 TPA_asm: hypothetical protein HUJ06_001190 [Nelumbo nucifera]